MSGFSVPIVENKFNIGVGALMGTIIGSSDNTSFGILYGNTTFGSKDKNLNIGMGWAFAGGKMAKNPTINISGMIRTGDQRLFHYFFSISEVPAV